MARLVSVCRLPEHTYDRRQMPLQVEDNLTMVLQFTDTCLGCDVVSVKRSDLESFANKFNLLTDEDISLALMATRRELFEHLAAAAVPCVGCRKSMERLYEQLMESGHATLDPLVVTKNGVLSVCRNFLFDVKAVYALFYVHGGKLAEVLGTLPKNKKNRRCQLHSLDMQKCKFTGNWFDVWELMSTDCKDELLLVDFDTLTDALEDYLVKHRFCGECKTKVQRAYTLLTGDGEVVAAAKKEKGYCATLYDGLKCCRQEKHLHVSCNADLVGRLIMRAEPDLIGSRRERHAKTMDVAQEEVLACLGSLLHERFGRVHQKLRLAEQTWRQLFYVGVDCLKKNFEVAVEKKQGVSNLERLCEEMALADKLKEQKRELKRQKKKDKKKAATKRPDDGSDACVDESSAAVEAQPPASGATVCQSDDDGSCGSCASEAADAAPSANRLRLAKDAVAKTDTPAACSSLRAAAAPAPSCQGPSPAAASAAGACSESASLSEASCCGNSWPEDESGCSALCASNGEPCAATLCDGAASALSPAGTTPPSPGCAAASVKASFASDPGYSSGADGSDSCACSEAACGEDDLCSGCEDHRSTRALGCSENRCSRGINRFRGPTLQEMLESSSATSPPEGADGGCDAIPDDEVAAFRAQKPTVTADRLALRKTLRQRFEQLIWQPPSGVGNAPPGAASGSCKS